MTETIGLTAEMYRAVVTIVDERVEEIRVTRQDFNELKGAVQELVQAQARTEQRVSGLERAMLELAQAQVRTEQRVEELVQAQARTEQRMGGLERAMQDLAQAQARTEEQIEKLVEAQRNLAQQVGALSDNIGYGLEDIARIMLPGYLQRHFGLALEGVLGEELNRRFFQIDSQEVEINLYGEGERDGQRVVVLGESKSRIFEREVVKFANSVALVEPVIKGELMRVMFGYVLHPSAEEVARERDVLLVASYQR